ncbi:MAG: flippase-like domain-containing protein [Actinobacteria bacterium]|nr:MAG: flippase-like domain-containing protein [Actinomycetota bacterium]
MPSISWFLTVRDSDSSETNRASAYPAPAARAASTASRTMSSTRRKGTASRALVANPRRAADCQAMKRVIQILISLAIVVAVFAYALPKIADYRSVWSAISSLSPGQFVILLLVTGFNIFTYWPQMMASMRGLTLGQAAVNNQTSTTVANTVPAGGVVAIGITVAMYRSWGFSYEAITLSELVTFVWNTFTKLALPIVALAILAVQGTVGSGLLAAAIFGLAFLLVAIVLFGLVLWKKALARRIGSGLGRAVSFLRRIVRRPPVGDWGESAVRFRHDSIDLIAHRWVALTISTVVSHIGLYLVLLISLRYVGVTGVQISWAEVLGVFAFVRLLSALPLTPGGLGVVELGYIGGLVLAGRHHLGGVSSAEFHAQVAAAVLLFRALTYGLQIPIGGVTYVIWKRKRSWLKPAPPRVSRDT